MTFELYRYKIMQDYIYFVFLKVLIDWNKLGYYICSEATYGKKAMQFILQHHADVVVTCIRMPPIDGLSLIR